MAVRGILSKHAVTTQGSDPQLFASGRIGRAYQELIESAVEAMVVVDSSGAIVLVNGHAERLFGYEHQELEGLRVEALLPRRLREVHRTELRSYLARPHLREIGSGIGVFGLRKDGTEFPADISLSPLETEEGTFVSSSIRDITAIRRAEYLASQMMAIVNSSHDAIIGTDLDGLVTSWNRGAEVLFGYSEAEMLNRPAALVDAAGHDQETQLEQKPAGSEEWETVRIRKDGTNVDVSITCSPILGTDGTLKGQSTIARDISERRERQELKDAFLAMVSHELRTPLSAILAHVELLIDEDLSTEEGDRFVKVIHRNSLRLDRLVVDLLFVSQLQAADLTVAITEVDIVAVAQEAVEAATPQSKQCRIDLRFEPYDGVILLNGDADRLGQVLDNLIANAMKYSVGGGVVCVRVVPTLTECVVEVEDHGMGITLDDQKHVFERFFRASAAVDGRIQGVGLGLMVVKTIVEAHGGRVGIESKPGSGSIFRVTLPLRSDEGSLPVWPVSDRAASAGS